MRYQEFQQLDIFKPFKNSSDYIKKSFKFIDLFAGIGGFRIPLEQIGGTCIGYSEIDKEAINIYKKNFLKSCNHSELELGSITEIVKLPEETDLVVGGVPCQPWSVAGRMKGFDDPRGKLWFDVLRLLYTNQPKAFIFENVRGLTSPKNKPSFEYLLYELEKANYCIKWKVVNSYDFGVPQSRERVFIVGIRKDLSNAQEYQFPQSLAYRPRLVDVIDEIKDCQIVTKKKLNPNILFGGSGSIPPSRNRFQKDDELNDFFTFSDLRNGHTTIHSWDIIDTTKKEKLICLTLLKSRRKKQYGEKDGNPLTFEDLQSLIPEILIDDVDKLIAKKILRETDKSKFDFVNSKNSSGINGVYRIFLPQSEMIPTLTATGAKDFIATVSINADHPEKYKHEFLEKIYHPQKFKHITARDACKLQGFPDWFEFHYNEGIAKKQFGNAVSIPAVYYVAKELINILDLPH